ncbi:MerR family DNA-binding transcriptional regulator [Alicyclobacillus sp. SO9]|uniref:MerR family transcriptional regulator n=1 Tax=Alicyclobacillus sp. SO9 TaxID=2665646 RepID=UPI0018E8EE12|nr:MerR family DNA-binding transcriptional regulator [Alicyclobacillus sp. SO9]QQE79087.1 MerR family DNA-binding transcriptional regulator [Alicyclobacillus sp. SO9]
MDPIYTISDLTNRFDITARTLRYYEEIGLIAPERRGGQRLYHDSDRVRIQLILRGRRLGFSLQEIAEMIDLYNTDPTEVTQLEEVIERGDVKISEINRQIQDLTAVRDELLELRQRMQQTLEEKRRTRGDE